MKLSCLMQQLYSKMQVTGLCGLKAMCESRHLVPTVAHRARGGATRFK